MLGDNLKLNKYGSGYLKLFNHICHESGMVIPKVLYMDSYIHVKDEIVLPFRDEVKFDLKRRQYAEVRNIS